MDKEVRRRKRRRKSGSAQVSGTKQAWNNGSQVFLRQEELRHRYKRHAKLSADITACVSTIGVWASITAICVILGGPTEAPIMAGAVTTIVIWALRKMDG